MVMRDGILAAGGRVVIKKIKNTVVLAGCYGAGVVLAGVVLMAPYIIDEN